MDAKNHPYRINTSAQLSVGVQYVGADGLNTRKQTHEYNAYNQRSKCYCARLLHAVHGQIVEQKKK